MNLKVEEEGHKSFSSSESATHKTMGQMSEMQNGYDTMLRKLESEVREHIRVEQQLKAQLESSVFAKEAYEHLKRKFKSLEGLNREVVFSICEIVARREADDDGAGDAGAAGGGEGQGRTAPFG